MTSITGKASVGRIKHLAMVPARHRYLSVEPLVQDPQITPALLRDAAGKSVIDWLNVGGESDQGQFQGREFKVEWARALIAVAREVGAAPFIKQLGSNPTLNGRPMDLPDVHGGKWEAWPRDVRVREMPPESALVAA